MARYKFIETVSHLLQINLNFKIKAMEQSQHEQRQAAAKDFQQSLGELQHILQENSAEEEIPKLPDDNISDEQFADRTSVIDLAAWEDAVADIEQYLQEKEKADS
ncbi:hypothetical protein [Chlorogloeopsis fritschii]|uniref:hypothetical protein n=1 Tax=Chlorogloeopsis fritschii TaxID=1124 RepID=UPI0030B83863